MKAPAGVWRGSLTLSAGLVLYLGPGGSAASHAHHAAQVIVSFDEPFELVLEGGCVRSRAAVVPSGVRHQLEAAGRHIAIALVEPRGVNGAPLQQRSAASVDRDLTALLDTGAGRTRDAVSMTAFGARLLGALEPGDTPRGPASAHVRLALGYLDEALDSRPLLRDAARAAHISAPRLTHLFTAEVGMPFRRYVLWLRLRRAAERVRDGASLTEAAIDAGFSDSAHLSRVFRSTFGLPPSTLLGMEVTAGAWPA